MRIGWIQDHPEIIGGAELTMREFSDAAPDGTLIAECGGDWVWPEEVDVWVVGNCVTYDASVIERLQTAPVVKYVHDMWPHGDPVLREWLLANATCVFCSPLHRDRFPWTFYATEDFVAPPVDLERFRQAAKFSPGPKQGTIWLGHGLNHAKGIFHAHQWAEANGPVDFYGEGPLMPKGAKAVDYADVPDLLARYERFLFLPQAIEPFARTVVEAWAAGCKLVVNRNIGAIWWIENHPDELERGAERFWEIVEQAV